MSDPTELILVTTMLAAVGIFAITAAVRYLSRPALVKVEPPPFDPAELEFTPPSSPADESSPYRPPVVPPPLPWATPAITGIPIKMYHPLDLLGLAAIFFIFYCLAVSSVQTPGTEAPVATSFGLLISIGFQFMIAGVVAATLVSRIHPVDWLGLRWKNWLWVLLIAPGTVVGMWLLFAFIQSIGYMDWMKSLGVEPVQDSVKILQESKDITVIVLMAVAAVIAAPICEEIVFRGYLYPLAKRFSGPWVGGLFSAVVFGCAHGNLAALLPLTIFGIVLVVIYEKTGSLWATMAVHFCFNGATVTIQILDRYYHFLPKDSL